jgi:cytoskeletal protein RodZ
MKSFGDVIKKERVAQNLTLDELEKATKIKRQFLIALEKENWEVLPEFPVVQGFVRLIGHALDVDENKLVAFLRRDYPPRPLPLNPKPDVGDKFKWTPKITFSIGIIVLVLLVAGYLFYQYSRFVSPPMLAIDFPPDNYVAKSVRLQVSGSTTPDSTVLVNNQPFLVDENGKFSGEIELSKETREIEIKATSRSGKDTKVVKKISTDF